MTRITVVLSDVTRIGCELLAHGIQRRAENFDIVGCETTVQGIVECARKHRPDIIVLSANLQDGALAGLGALRELGALNLPTRTIILFDDSRRELVVGAFRGGARGVFFRDDPVEVLCKSITRVHEGQIWAGTNEIHYVLEALAAAVPLRSADLGSTLPLTDREQQIVALVAQGLSNREISQRLHLSEHTVKNYLFRIFDKTGVSSRVELVLYATHRNRAA